MKYMISRWDPLGALMERERTVGERCLKYRRILGIKLGMSKKSILSSWTLVKAQKWRRVRQSNRFGKNEFHARLIWNFLTKGSKPRLCMLRSCLGHADAPPLVGMTKV
jgi:hypothetical protein